MKNKLTREEVAKALENVALKDKEHLKRWLVDSGRKYLVLDSVHLVDSLPFPEGIQLLQSMLNCYREYRRGIPTGDKAREKNPIDGTDCFVDIMHEEVLSVSELDLAIRYLINQLTNIDSAWKLE